MLTNIVNSIQRKKSRYSTKKIILAGAQQNNKVVNIHCHNTPNIGDKFSAPHNYFEKLNDTALEILDYYNPDEKKVLEFQNRIIKNQWVIGGGGLLNRNGFEFSMHLFEVLAQKNKKAVLWGLGHNSKHQKDFNKITNYNIDVSKFGLVGTRDYSMPGEYVPCVSCMHPIFDQKFNEVQDTGIIFHKDTYKDSDFVAQFKDYPSISNTYDLEALISFIGKTEYIITDSYHGMYWSMLLNKKVTVIPNSSKFFDFKYKPVFTSFEDCLKDSAKSKRNSGILEESREINMNFYEKVANYLNL